MGNCAGKPKTVEGVKPEAADQVADDAKATTLNSGNGETTAEDKNDDAKATNEDGEKKDEKKEPVLGLLDAKEEDEDVKKPALVNDELKTEAPAEAEKVAEEKKQVEEVST